MLYLLMGVPVIYVCTAVAAAAAAAPCCSDAIGFNRANIIGPLQSMPLVSLINLLSVAWFFSSRCFPLINKWLLWADHHWGVCASSNLPVFLSLSQSAAWLLAPWLLGGWPATEAAICQKPFWLHPLKCHMQVTAGIRWVHHQFCMFSLGVWIRELKIQVLPLKHYRKNI